MLRVDALQQRCRRAQTKVRRHDIARRLPLGVNPVMTKTWKSKQRRRKSCSSPNVSWIRFEIAKPKGRRLRVLIYATRRTRLDFAEQLRWLVDERYPEARRIKLVCDNLNTHNGASLYEAFDPAEARRILTKIEFVYTPKHGSWLNIAECELSVLSRQCLNRRLESTDILCREVAAWENDRNATQTGVDWQFTAADARIKLKRLYPKIQN
jgi:hypothetical protein